MASARFLITGRVQGVGYRYFVRREAQALGVVGYVQNLDDGSVEVVAEAPQETLELLAERLREGPPFAEVDRVERSPAPPAGGRGFFIR